MPLFLLLLLAAAGFAQAGEDARTLLREVAEASRNLTTYRAEGHIVQELDFGPIRRDTLSFCVATRAPQQMRIEMTGGEEWATGLSYTAVCNGQSGWAYFDRAKHYQKVGVDPLTRGYCATGSLTSFEHVADNLLSAKIAGKRHSKFEGRSQPCVLVQALYRVIKDVMVPPAPVVSIGRVSRTMCVDPARKLILEDRLEAEWDPGPNGIHLTETVTYDKIERNPDLSPALFEFHPPEGATLFTPRNPPPAEAPPAARARTTPAANAVAEPISKVEPEYTQEAWDDGIEGTVPLEVKVGVDGTVLDIRSLETLGYGLDEKAVECVRKWRFNPALNTGRPVVGGRRIDLHFSLPDKRPDRPTEGPVIRPVRPPRLPVVELKPPTALDKFFCYVAHEFKSPALCGRIHPLADGGGSGRPEKGYQIQTMQSECYFALAGELNDATLCDRLRPVRTEDSDGSKFDKTFCRANLRRFVHSVPFDSDNTEAVIGFMRKSGYGDEQVAEHRYQTNYLGSSVHRTYRRLLKDREFLTRVRTAQSYSEPRSPKRIRPALPAEYLYRLVAIDTDNASLCAKISPNATFIARRSRTALLQSECYAELAYSGSDATLCNRLPPMGTFPHTDDPYFSREVCHMTIATSGQCCLSDREICNFAAHFPKPTYLEMALRRIGYRNIPASEPLPKPTADDYMRYFYHLVHRATPGERARFVYQVMTLR